MQRASSVDQISSPWSGRPKMPKLKNALHHYTVKRSSANLNWFRWCWATPWRMRSVYKAMVKWAHPKIYKREYPRRKWTLLANCFKSKWRNKSMQSNHVNPRRSAEIQRRSIRRQTRLMKYLQTKKSTRRPLLSNWSRERREERPWLPKVSNRTRLWPRSRPMKTYSHLKFADSLILKTSNRRSN